MKLHGLAIAALLLIPLTASAQEDQAPASKADEAARPEGEPPRMRGFMGMRRRSMGISVQDTEQAAQFMRENSPSRWKTVEDMPEDSSDRRAVMAFIVARWRTLQSIRDEDAQLYEIKLKQLHIEDDIYAMLATTPSAAEREPLRPKLRESVSELLNLGLLEREHRIAQLGKLLKTEQQKLDADRKRLSVAADRRAGALVADGPSALRPAMPQWPMRMGPYLPENGEPKQPATKPNPTP
jgi:hypothetical protein